MPFMPRLSLILKSCLSNSNSEMEFFFMRSMMALMSFRSTSQLVVQIPPPRFTPKPGCRCKAGIQPSEAGTSGQLNRDDTNDTAKHGQAGKENCEIRMKFVKKD
jgi:hypothetical protein